MTKSDLIEIIIGCRPALRHQREALGRETHAFLAAEADYFTAPTPAEKEEAKTRMFRVRQDQANRIVQAKRPRGRGSRR